MKTKLTPAQEHLIHLTNLVILGDYDKVSNEELDAAKKAVEKEKNEATT